MSRTAHRPEPLVQVAEEIARSLRAAVRKD